MAYLYKHIRLDNNKVFYIGIGSDLNYKRAYSKYDRNKYWKNITNKCEYAVKIFLDNLSWEEACIKEQQLIKKYGRKDLKKGTLVNMTDGGEGTIGKICSNKTRKKLSDSHKGQIPWNKGVTISKEIRKKLSDSHKGQIPWNKGKTYKTSKIRKHSIETKKKISESLKNRKLNQKTKEKISLANKGKFVSLETRLKLSKISKGRKHSIKTKEKISKSLKKYAKRHA